MNSYVNTVEEHCDEGCHLRKVISFCPLCGVLVTAFLHKDDVPIVDRHGRLCDTCYDKQERIR